MARFYTNENFPKAVVELLRQMGHDVLISLDAGRANLRIPDREVLDFAIAQQRILLTHNRKDFKRLHVEVPEHFGIVICTENPDFAALANDIHTLTLTGEQLRNQLIRVVRGN